MSILNLLSELSLLVDLGRFSISSALSHLANGMGLLALAAAIVDTLAIYVFAKKDDYFKAKYQYIKVHDDQLESKTKAD